MNAALRERLEAERAEARELFARMRPELVLQRLREGPGEEPTAQPSAGGGARSTLAVVAACFVLGLLLARLLDWRGHAHPQD